MPGCGYVILTLAGGGWFQPATALIYLIGRLIRKIA